MNSVTNAFSCYLSGLENKSINLAECSKINLNFFPEEIFNVILNQADFNSLKNLRQSSLFFKEITDNSQKYKDGKHTEEFAKKIITNFKPFINLVKFSIGDYSKENGFMRTFKEERDIDKALMQCAGILDIKLNNISVNLDYEASIIDIPKSYSSTWLYPNYNPKMKCCYTSEVDIYTSFKESKSDILVEQAIDMAKKEINLHLEKKLAEAKSLTY
ncbi:MAG: hypothetical protein H0V82_09535 [Candidatus Protochlamydia sp.]|nr:hypothetical protein [Candidatus Protochlamydia sp.]